LLDSPLAIVLVVIRVWLAIVVDGIVHGTKQAALLFNG
jgi:hypothetical protein